MASAEPVGLGPGALLAGRYQIEATLGNGGGGQVFRAWDRTLGEPVAIKILHPDRAREKTWIKRLAREVRVARAIRHPNVCRVFDMGSADGHWFVSMELAAGGALRQMLRRNPDRPFADRLSDARAVCAGLAAIHGVGITHRDVTPQNVLRMADGRLVLSDFGLAVERDIGLEVSLHGGTPSYMPPEAALRAAPDVRSDVWQMGLLLHEILFGRRAEWQQDETGRTTLRWPLERGAPPVEQALARLVRQCLAQSPAERPANAIAVAGLLEAATEAGSRSLLSRWAERALSGDRGRRRIALAVAAASLVSLAAAVGAVVAVHADRQRESAGAAPASSGELELRPGHDRGALPPAAGTMPLGPRRPIWDAEQREATRRAFLGSGVPGGASAFDEVDRLFRRYAPVSAPSPGR